ncbi:MAG: SAM-dependent chlorinase/fluorinase, partial [Candidatus Brocadiales bacterium]|nr:SAM-dependent chlorinase/fluorinase [Candidatus Brocadiales bacterium]
IIRVTNSKYFLPLPSNTFHGRDVFAPVAAHLSLGVKPQQLGIKINQLEQLNIPKPVYKKTGQIEGQIIYIDRFGNLITNITREHIKDLKTTQKRMETSVGKKRILGLCNTYADVKAGEPLVLFGSAGFLEVSINQGNAQKYFKVDKGDRVIVEID